MMRAAEPRDRKAHRKQRTREKLPRPSGKRRSLSRRFELPRQAPGSILLPDHLLIPYGVPKWDIGMVRLAAITPQGSRLTSAVPLVHIRPSERTGYRLADHAAPEGLDGARAVLARLGRHADRRATFERRFLKAYLAFVETLADPLQALAPIPQAHLYLADPLEGGEGSTAELMIKADFAFWTGSGFLVVEIDGASHIGSTRHVIRDRALRAAGVEVVHILNEEIAAAGPELIGRLLPVLAAASS